MLNIHKDLIEQIIAIELEMFLAVPAGKENSCQKNPEAFRRHRQAQFIPWSDKTLSSYLSDLEAARIEGRNLMTEKYLMMERPAPLGSDQNPLIEKIASSQLIWQEEMFAKYPKVMSGARPLSQAADSSAITSFTTYLKCELKTYSDKTLDLLYQDITEHQKNNRSMAEETYKFLAQAAGYKSIDQAERLRP